MVTATLPSGLRRRRAHKLRSRLIGAYLLPSVVLVALFCLAVFGTVRRLLEEELGARLIAVAQSVAGPMSASRDGERLRRLRGDMTRVRANLRKKVEDVRRATGVQRISLFAPDLTSRVDTDPDVPFGRKLVEFEADSLEIRQVLAGGTAASVLFTGSDGVRYKRGYAPVFAGGEVVAVVAAEGSPRYYATLDRFAMWLAGWGLGLGAMVVVISVVVARHITRPVARLVEVARSIVAGGGSAPPAPGDGEAAASGPPGPASLAPAGSSWTDADGRGIEELVFLGQTLEETARTIRARQEELQVMLTGIAHEVRNPLGGMELFGGLLREELAGDPERLPYVERILKEIGYLKNVVEDFLGYTRRMPLARKVVPLRPLVEEVALLVAGEAEARGIRVEVRVPEDLAAWLDPGSTRRAFLNLMRNAVQAMPEGGCLTVEARAAGGEPTAGEGGFPGGGGGGRRTTALGTAAGEGPGAGLLFDGEPPAMPLPGLSEGRCAPAVEIVISDTGQGMGPDTLDRAFVPFFTTREKGTGLGLAIVRKVVEEHGGTVHIESARGLGTSVTIRLPGGPPR